MTSIKHGAEAQRNDAYKANRLNHHDWDIIEQSLAVLQAPAHVTKLLEGTNYATVSLVIPSIYRLLEGLSSPSIFLMWKPPAQQWMPMSQVVPE
eukprot:scaffold282834_cov30-Tisochrysis_lutea.AAC.1